MEKEQKNKSLGKLIGCVVPFLVTLLLQLVGAMVFIIIYTIVKVVQNITTYSTEVIVSDVMEQVTTTNFTLWLSVVIGIINIIVFGLWYRKLNKKEEVKSKVMIKGKDFLIIAIIGVSLQFSISLILGLLSEILPNVLNNYSDHMSTLDIGGSLVSFLYVVIIAPISEELTFRGVTFTKAKRIFTLLVANVFQALLFGIMHFNLVQSTYAFALGLIIGYIGIKYRKLYMAIFLHFIVNLSGVVLSVLTEGLYERTTSIISIVGGIVGTIVLIYALRYLSKKEIKVEYAEEIESSML